jgi:hypothetical protein
MTHINESNIGGNYMRGIAPVKNDGFEHSVIQDTFYIHGLQRTIFNCLVSIGNFIEPMVCQD